MWKMLVIALAWLLAFVWLPVLPSVMMDQNVRQKVWLIYRGKSIYVSQSAVSVTYCCIRSLHCRHNGVSHAKIGHHKVERHKYADKYKNSLHIPPLIEVSICALRDFCTAKKHLLCNLNLRFNLRKKLVRH
jgi:hypothetical protein